MESVLQPLACRDVSKRDFGLNEEYVCVYCGEYKGKKKEKGCDIICDRWFPRTNGQFFCIQRLTWAC